ncbi:hypothetical protein PR048_023100 [Dryococelus australis]|uniref:PiggyBac transposable element-derived protein domain-containing protein n=1 Tax=Dryococelus australis TaxID=614101 RepID=A0ABQ9GT67_9NEOP|nr:hypothetical protein PR048_023100 [Dryococelus australis]
MVISQFLIISGQKCQPFIIKFILKKYAARNNKLGDISCEEMKCFIGILLLSGYVSVPTTKLYWEESSDRYNRIVSNALSWDGFEFIIDRSTKVRPLFTVLNDRLQAYAPHSETHSVDEAMVPYFVRHGRKQFIRGKPIRHGYKLWVGATSSGYVIWLEPYQGARSVIPEQYRSLDLGPSVVLQYAYILSFLGEFPHHILFDNFFTTVPFLGELKKRRLKGTGTIRDNRNPKCSLETTACMKKNKRESFYSKVKKDKSIIIAKCHDNSIVSAASNAEPVHPLHSVSRFLRTLKKIVKVPRRHCMYALNTGMRGIDRREPKH